LSGLLRNGGRNLSIISVAFIRNTKEANRGVRPERTHFSGGGVTSVRTGKSEGPSASKTEHSAVKKIRRNAGAEKHSMRGRDWRTDLNKKSSDFGGGGRLSREGVESRTGKV